MYKHLKTKPSKTTLKVNTSYTGETIEQKVDRILNNKEPISDGAPIVYTDRKDGVRPEHDIRTDRFDVAIDAMDKVTATHQAKREARLKAKEEGKLIDMNKKEGGEGNKGNEGTSANTNDK